MLLEHSDFEFSSEDLSSKKTSPETAFLSPRAHSEIPKFQSTYPMFNHLQAESRLFKVFDYPEGEL